MSTICTLKRCQGKRGCLCPKGTVPIGAYAGRKLDPIAPAPQSIEVSAATPTKAATKLQTPVRSSSKPKLEPIKSKDSLLKPNKLAGSSSVSQQADTEVSKLTEPDGDMGIPEVDGVDGEVMIRYNHYKKKFVVAKGSTTSAAIDAEYFLSFAFPNCKIHVTQYGPSDFTFEQSGFSTRPLIFEDPVGTYWGLDPTKEYWVDVEEDSSERKAYEERQDALAKESAAKRAEQELRGDAGADIIKSKTESCSCIEGNPCLDRYACKDWEHRYDVAKRNGWKGFQ